MNELYIQRHFKLWEDKNKLLKRIVFLTVAISLALVVKVLVPFMGFSQDKKPLLKEISDLKIEIKYSEGQLKSLENTYQALTNAKLYISKRP